MLKSVLGVPDIPKEETAYPKTSVNNYSIHCVTSQKSEASLYFLVAGYVC
jgi:hypothetical protein